MGLRVNTLFMYKTMELNIVMVKFAISSIKERLKNFKTLSRKVMMKTGENNAVKTKEGKNDKVYFLVTEKLKPAVDH